MVIKNKAIWLFGLSGAGKTSLALEIQKQLNKAHQKNILLDGDIIRTGINKNLGFGREDRKENVRRIAEISKLMLQVHIIPIVAAITPYRSDRELIKEIIGEDQLIMVYVQCPLEQCESRDPKGLYEKARKNELRNFTGISDTFEIPLVPAVIIDTETLTIGASLDKLFNEIKNHEIRKK
jgi:adenylylsulfate kinase